MACYAVRCPVTSPLSTHSCGWQVCVAEVQRPFRSLFPGRASQGAVATTSGEALDMLPAVRASREIRMTKSNLNRKRGRTIEDFCSNSISNVATLLFFLGCSFHPKEFIQF
uniref:(northern house mosquito) hypothetical protein n=1 Tax=Culex pipiens TaxID=7175 RepID=A0A8D8BTD0_CULPI